MALILFYQELPSSAARKVTDIALLKTIARFLASVIGSPVSVKSVTDYLVSGGRKISSNTVNDYMEELSESFVFYPVERFDIVGKAAGDNSGSSVDQPGA